MVVTRGQALMTFDSEMCKCIWLISAQRNPFLEVCCNWGPLQLWHNVTTSTMKSIFHTQACSFLPEYITLLNNCQRGLFSETTTPPQRIAMGKKTRLYGIIIMPQNQIKIFLGALPFVIHAVPRDCWELFFKKKILTIEHLKQGVLYYK